MKKLLPYLLLFLCTQLHAQEDTLKYIKYPNTYGVKYPRFWGDYIRLSPKDTVQVNDLPGVLQTGPDGFPYWWDGLGWRRLSNTGDLTPYIKTVDGDVRYLLRQTPGLVAQYYGGEGLLHPFPTVLSYFSNDQQFLNPSNGVVYLENMTALASSTEYASPKVVRDPVQGGVFKHYTASEAATAGITVDSVFGYLAVDGGVNYRIDVDYKTIKGRYLGISSAQTSTVNTYKLRYLLNLNRQGVTYQFDPQETILMDSLVTVWADGYHLDGLKAAHDETKPFWGGITFTGSHIEVSNCYYDGKSAFNDDSQRRSAFINSGSYNYFHEISAAYVRKNLFEEEGSYNTYRNIRGDSVYRDVISMTPSFHTMIYNVASFNGNAASLGGGGCFEISDGCNDIMIDGVHAEHTAYTFDIDYHINGQTNNNIKISNLYAYRCGTIYTHGIGSANNALPSQNWTFENFTEEEGQGNLQGNGAIDMAGNVIGITIKNITIINPQYTGVRVKIRSTSQLVLNGLKIIGSRTARLLTVDGGPVYNNVSQPGRVCEITNVFEDSVESSAVAIFLDNYKYATVHGNFIRGTSNTLQTGRIIEADNVDTLHMYNNFFMNSSVHGIYINPSAAHTGYRIIDNWTGGTGGVRLNGTFYGLDCQVINSGSFSQTGSTAFTRVSEYFSPVSFRSLVYDNSNSAGSSGQLPKNNGSGFVWSTITTTDIAEGTNKYSPFTTVGNNVSLLGKNLSLFSDDTSKIFTVLGRSILSRNTAGTRSFLEWYNSNGTADARRWDMSVRDASGNLVIWPGNDLGDLVSATAITLQRTGGISFGGISDANSNSYINLAPGTATIGLQRWMPGTDLTSAVANTWEYDGMRVSLTIGSTRNRIPFTTDATATTGSVMYFDGTRWVYLAPGTSRQKLSISASTGLPVWQDTTASSGNNYVLQASSANQNPADGASIYVGPNAAAAGGTANVNRSYIPKAGTIKAVYVTFHNSGTLGTSETSTFVVRLNNSTNTTVSAAVTNDALFTTYSNTGLSIAVNAGDYVEGLLQCATWATNPTAVRISVTYYIE